MRPRSPSGLGTRRLAEPLLLAGLVLACGVGDRTDRATDGTHASYGGFAMTHTAAPNLSLRRRTDAGVRSLADRVASTAACTALRATTTIDL